MGVTFTFDLRTELIVGPGSWRQAVPRVASLGRRVLLVTGAHSLDHCGIRGELERLLTPLGPVTRVVVASEPDTVIADAAATQARVAKCDVVLGIGGGSVLDVAKAVAGLAVNDGVAREYLEGLPQPRSMLRQAIQLAAGATPIWLPKPSSPVMVPMVCVPWLLSSQGTVVLSPQGLLPGFPNESLFNGLRSWMASCQL